MTPVSSINRATATKSLSLAFAVGTYALAFGAASVAAGFSILQTSLLSLLLFSGASQFAVIGVIGAGGTALTAIATSTLLGFRNALYGIVMTPILQVKGFKKVVAAQITIDESTGVALGEEDRGISLQRQGFWLTGFGVFFFWNIFTVIGALSASTINNPAEWGLDTAVPAAFIALVWPRLKTKNDIFLALAATALALITTPILPTGLPIIATAGLAVLLGWRVR